MKVIVTVGTSIFENNDNDIDIASIEGQSFDEWENLSYEIQEIEDKLEVNNLDDDCCAEVSSILKLVDIEKIILLVTDTIEGALAGKIIKKVLQQKGFNKIEFELEYQKGIIKDLRVDKLDTFTKGVDNLINKILDITNGKFNDTILNITGGYKAIIPYLTIIGQISNSKIVYIFENSDELIELPKLPIGFDEKIADLYLPYMNNYILNNISDNTTIHKLINLKLIKNINNKLEVTSLGNFFKNEMNHKPSSFGDLIELLLFSRYSKENINKKVFQGVEYKNMDCNGKKVEGDIDIIIEDNNLVELYEIKSLSQVKKFLTEQISKYICYIQQNFNEKENKQIILFVYLVEGNLLSIFDEDFKNINLPNDIKFKIQYIELPLNNLQGKIREFKDIQIQEKRIPNV